MAKNCKASITSSIKPGVAGARFTRAQKGYPQVIATTKKTFNQQSRNLTRLIIILTRNPD